MKRTQFLAEISKLSVGDLKERAKQLAEEQMKLRFQKARSAQLDQPHRLGEVKKNLAQVNTVLNAKLRLAMKVSESSDSQTGLNNQAVPVSK